MSPKTRSQPAPHRIARKLPSQNPQIPRTSSHPTQASWSKFSLSPVAPFFPPKNRFFVVFEADVHRPVVFHFPRVSLVAPPFAQLTLNVRSHSALLSLLSLLISACTAAPSSGSSRITGSSCLGSLLGIRALLHQVFYLLSCHFQKVNNHLVLSWWILYYLLYPIFSLLPHISQSAYPTPLLCCGILIRVSTWTQS